MSEPETDIPRGPIAWMARNAVAANLLMIVLLVGGFLLSMRIKQEVFPEFDLDIITIQVPYPRATPSMVEKGIILAVEEAVSGLDGVKKVTSNSGENMGTVAVELLLETDPNKALQDVKNAIDRITTFPDEAEKPTVSLISTRREVLSLVVYGDQEEGTLRVLAERMRGELLQDPDITYVQLSGIRPLEIDVALPQDKQRAHGLKHADVARKIRSSAVELPGGYVKTSGGDVLLRLDERRDLGSEFGNIPLVTSPDGTHLRLDDLATVTDGFAETDQAAFYNGKRAVLVKVFRVGDQTPIQVADAVENYLKGFKTRLPEGLKVDIVNDMSEIYRDRIDLLLRNARLGLILVLVILGLFLEVRLAFWVTLGIPISMLGSMLFMPFMDVSINMISLFAFIVTIGIVVDDAIVVGENVYEYRQRGMPILKASILGARRIATPVTFAILTNIVAFMPMFFVPGIMGKIFRVIPAVVITVYAVSLVEALFILPAHLGHQKSAGRRRGPLGWLHRGQQAFARLLERFIHNRYRRVLRGALRNRYFTVAVGIAILAATVGFVRGGHISMGLMPTVESDFVVASVVLPYGSPVADTNAAQARLVEKAREVLARHGGERITRGILSLTGTALAMHGPGGGGASGSGGHQATVLVYLVPTDKRDIGAEEFVGEWRQAVGDVAGLESLTFTSSLGGPSGGAAIDVQLSHPDVAVLEQAADELAGKLTTFTGVKDVDNGFSLGKPQLSFKPTNLALSEGLDASTIAAEVRNAFYGAEALRQQRGRDEIKVMVRLPESERQSEYNVEELMIRLPGGGEIPLRMAADVERGRAYTEIRRAEGNRVVDVTADVERGVTDPGQVIDDLKEDFLPDLIAKHAGLSFSLEGEQREMSEAMGTLKMGFGLAMLVMYALLAIPFRSYLQPLVVMAAIPFGIVGAIVGHVIMGYNLSVISMMGIVALAGVVVNDALILMDAANKARARGETPFEAISQAGVRRFRPILLTSLTTFFGLAPMIFETSMQARFLIPMALSLGFGILASTLIVLLLIPSLYLIAEDLRGAAGWIKALYVSEATDPTRHGAG